MNAPHRAADDFQKTKRAYSGTRILGTPFWALYALVPFIMCKDLGATPFQIACVFSLKPIVSLLSLYWSSLIKKRGDRLVSNIVWATVFSHLPFLFIPWIFNAWYFVFASATYMLFHRGVQPAWMEILKRNASEEERKSVFAFGSAAYHVGGALLALLIGCLLDIEVGVWRFLFPLTAVISLCSIFFQLALPDGRQPSAANEPSLSCLERFQAPWKEAWSLLKKRRDFAHFQLGFMLGGGGLMLWQPALPLFFFDTLQINYKELTLAMTFCKAIGYACALPFWMRVMSRVDIFSFSGLVTILAALFPLALMAAKSDLLWLYGAYLLYGFMQAGSELSWNLSGPIFSKEEESATYTEVNVVTIGLRGCLAPPLGSLLCYTAEPKAVLFIGFLFCLIATWQMMRQSQEVVLAPKSL